jgi:flagellar biosynthetic protein FliO
MRILSLILLLLCFFTVPLSADGFSPPTQVAQEVLHARSHYWEEFANMIVTLIFVLALAFATLYVVRKIMRSKIKHLNKTTGIKILERRSLNPKASLYLVDVLGKGIVIAESQAGIHLITEFPDGHDVELILSSFQEETKPTVSFPDVLQKKINGLFKK